MYDIQTELILRRMDREASAADSARMTRGLAILANLVVWALIVALLA